MRLLLLLMHIFPVISSQMCVQCVPGKYRSNDIFTTSCQNCAPNTYSPLPGMTACQPCPGNSSSTAGSSTCTCVQNYVKASNSQECFFECAAGLVNIRNGCECPVGTSGPPNGPCAQCAVHTYAAEADMRTCTACPEGMRSVVGSVSSDACMCGVGFVKESTGICSKLLDVSVVLNFDVALVLPASVTTEDVKQTILRVVSATYNISVEYLIVDIVLQPAVSSRRLMQAGTYSVTVRILFESSTPLAYVNQTQNNVAVLNVDVMTAGILLLPLNTSFVVSTITLRGSRDEKGVFNANSQQVVSCILVPWRDELGEAQACVLTCRVDEDVYAVLYLQGLYVLGCRPKPETTAMSTTTPTPGESSTDAPWMVIFNVFGGVVIFGGVVGGIVALFIITCCICCKRE